MSNIGLVQNFTAAAHRLIDRCEQLAKITSMPDGVARFYLTAEHKAANALVKRWMEQAGLDTWEDAAANIWGRYTSNTENAPTVILGSHLDTVANAGKYDGILGVLSAIAVVEQLHKQKIGLPFHIDVVGFGDEEGVRFGSTLLGSCAVAGKWDERWFELRDHQGISLRQALRDFGIGEQDVEQAKRSADNIYAYLEMHIEQGPILERRNLPVGVVTSIAGAKRYRFHLCGEAGHAGTVPMDMRKDPLIAASLAIAQIESIAKNANIVATVGQLNVFPGGVNVIPGRCEFSLDIRSGDDDARDAALNQIIENVEAICLTRHIGLDYKEIHHANSVACATWLQDKMSEAIQEIGYEALPLMSGAGHDAMVFAELTDIAMLFVRCAGGISHNPQEFVSKQDIEVALRVYYSVLLSLANSKLNINEPVNEKIPEIPG